MKRLMILILPINILTATFWWWGEWPESRSYSLGEHFPPAMCFHGGEHVLSIFSSELAKIEPIKECNVFIFFYDLSHVQIFSQCLVLKTTGFTTYFEVVQYTVLMPSSWDNLLPSTTAMKLDFCKGQEPNLQHSFMPCVHCCIKKCQMQWFMNHQSLLSPPDHSWHSRYWRWCLLEGIVLFALDCVSCT